MSELYEAHVDGREAKLPSLEVEYVDFAHWQRELLHGGLLDQQLEYIVETFKNVPA